MSQERDNQVEDADRCRRKRRRLAPGRRPSITLAVVKRVSKRYGRGVPLVDALAAEANPKINLDNWKKTLRRHPQLSLHYQAARGLFLELSMRRLAESKDLRHLCWLLERRYPELFRKPPDQSIASVAVSSTKDLSDAELLAIARMGDSDGTQENREEPI